MRIRLVLLVIFSVLMLSFSLVKLTAANPQRAQPQAAADKQAFDPHDYSGIYIRRGGDRGFGPPGSYPPLTPAGENVINTRVPTAGYNRHPLTKKIQYDEDSNDPAFACNPKGFPRILVDVANDYYENIVLP